MVPAFRLPALALLAAGLAGCGHFGGSGAPSVNGDTPIATTLDAPRGSPSDFDVNVGRRVFFTTGSDALSETDRVTLDKQAAWLKRYAPYRMVIEGYADDPGSPAANMELGRRRAVEARCWPIWSTTASPGRGCASSATATPARCGPAPIRPAGRRTAGS